MDIIEFDQVKPGTKHRSSSSQAPRRQLGSTEVKAGRNYLCNAPIPVLSSSHSQASAFTDTAVEELCDLRNYYSEQLQKNQQHFPWTAGSSGGTRCSVMFKRASEEPLPTSQGHHRPESLQPVALCRQPEEAAGLMGTSTMNLSHTERSCFRSSHMKSANCSELDSFCKTVFAFVPI